MADIRLPIWLMKSHAEGSSGPRAAGWKTCVVGKAAYFSALRFAALTDAGPTDAACGKMYDAAHVWTTVACHARYFPADQGTRVAPSGLLPSVLNRPAGSRVLGTPALLLLLLLLFLLLLRNCCIVSVQGHLLGSPLGPAMIK